MALTQVAVRLLSPPGTTPCRLAITRSSATVMDSSGGSSAGGFLSAGSVRGREGVRCCCAVVVVVVVGAENISMKSLW